MIFRTPPYSPNWNRRDEGIQIDESDEHPEKTNCSTHERRESMLNSIVERDLHVSKEYSLSFSTDEGMQIDERLEHSANADRPITES
jgi:hypothetical protein